MDVLSSLGDWYVENLSTTWVVPLLLFLAAIGILGATYASTGDVIYRDLSLQGGVSITALNANTSQDTVEATLLDDYPGQDINVRTVTELGEQIGVIIEADITPEEEARLDDFTSRVSSVTGVPEGELSVDTVGSSLGQQFFQQTLKAVWVAFLFMGACVFYYFGDTTKRKVTTAAVSVVTGIIVMTTSSIAGLAVAAVLSAGLLTAYTTYSIPSTAVILAALSDIIITVAILTGFQVKLGTASIAGLLMLIGYSVDTDILLSTRLLKETEDPYKDRVVEALKTGVTMTFTTLSAVTVTYFVAQSQTLRQIMLVLIVGLAVDIINTWLQNASILDIHRNWTT